MQIYRMWMKMLPIHFSYCNDMHILHIVELETSWCVPIKTTFSWYHKLLPFEFVYQSTYMYNSASGNLSYSRNEPCTMSHPPIDGGKFKFSGNDMKRENDHKLSFL